MDKLICQRPQNSRILCAQKGAAKLGGSENPSSMPRAIAKSACPEKFRYSCIAAAYTASSTPGASDAAGSVNTCATPDGRKAGFPFADGAGPAQGRETFGPTTAIRSVTSWDHTPLVGGCAFNMKFSKACFADAEAREKLLALIKTFIQQGGFETQINVVDPDVLIDADKHPENYPDLLVRIGGYSDFFTRLSPGMRKEVIMRTQNEL